MSGNRIVTQATDVSWDYASWLALGSSPEFDMEDESCGVFNNSLVQMYSAWSSLPNNGWNKKRHCGVRKAELELKVNTSLVSPAQRYYFGVAWNCINIGMHNMKVEFKNTSTVQLSRESANCTGTHRSMGAIDNTEIVSLNEENNTVAIYNGTVEDYSYTVQKSGDEYHVDVNIDFNNLNLDRFITTNNKFQTSLSKLSSKRSQLDSTIMVVVTFKTAMSQHDVMEFTSQIGMDLDEYAVFGTSDVDKHTISTYYNPSYSLIDEFPMNVMYDDQHITNDGVMMVMGTVQLENINLINAYSNIALLDVSANIIQNEIENELDIDISTKDIYIPNPSWIIYESDFATPTHIGLSNLSSHQPQIKLNSMISFMVIGIMALTITTIRKCRPI